MPIQDFSFGIIPLFWSGADWKCLLIHHQKGHWAFPKGHADLAEKPEQAAVRELQEETGLVPVRVWWDHSIIEHYTFTNPEGVEVVKEVVFWPAEVNTQSVRVQEEEVQDSAWLSLQDAEEKMTFAAGKQVLRDLQSLVPMLQPHL